MTSCDGSSAKTLVDRGKAAFGLDILMFHNTRRPGQGSNRGLQLVNTFGFGCCIGLSLNSNYVPSPCFKSRCLVLRVPPLQQPLQDLGHCASHSPFLFVFVVHQGGVPGTRACGGASVGMPIFAGVARARRQVQHSAKATGLAHGLRVSRHETQPDRVSGGYACGVGRELAV